MIFQLKLVGGCWCCTTLLIALTLSYRPSPGDGPMLSLFSFSLLRTHYNSHKHSCWIVYAERHGFTEKLPSISPIVYSCQTFSCRSVLYFNAASPQTPLERHFISCRPVSSRVCSCWDVALSSSHYNMNLISYGQTLVFVCATHISRCWMYRTCYWEIGFSLVYFC